MAFYRNCFTRLFYFISIIFILSNNAYATEYWKTSITYTETNLTAKGRKTNYETQLYVDDVIKKASLQFSENVKEKIGITAKDRIFNNLDRDGQYSSLASQDIISLLKLKDYKIDYDEKEIYLLKNTDGSVNCKNFFYKWKNPQGAEYKCPIDAANSRIEARCTGLITNCEVGDLYADQYFTTKILELSNDKSNAPQRIYFSISYTYNGTPGELTDYIIRGAEDDPVETDKEYLTNIKLAELLIANRNSIVELFTAANLYEITNNKAYLELAYALNSSSNEESPDSSINPDLDDDGNNTGGFNLPSFCDWAKPVCDAIAWLKEEVTGESDTEVDVEQVDMSSPDLETVLDYQKQCPAPIKIETEIIGYPFLYEFDFSLLCQYLNKLSIWLYAMSYFIGGLIIAGVRNA